MSAGTDGDPTPKRLSSNVPAGTILFLDVAGRDPPETMTPARGRSGCGRPQRRAEPLWIVGPSELALNRSGSMSRGQEQDQCSHLRMDGRSNFLDSEASSANNAANMHDASA
jgi:hypothetical protein